MTGTLEEALEEGKKLAQEAQKGGKWGTWRLMILLKNKFLLFLIEI